MTADADALREEADAIPWYQSIDLGHGVITRGDYDMASALRRVPLPGSLTGKRCLDVGTRDGFWAFEMERRGAREVVATDLASQVEVDLPEPRPQLDQETTRQLEQRNESFALARRALDSSVDWRALNVYDLDADEIGTFDFAFIGTLLLHLRNPVDALNAIRGVLAPGAVLLSNNPISLPLTLKSPLTPAAEILMRPAAPFFYVPNARGHRRMLEGAGFEIESSTRPYLFRYGEGWRRRPVRAAHGPLANQVIQLFGAVHTCLTARPKAARP